ncbi:MAG: hypothetical protein P4L96_12350 [Rhodoferax sp.]|nr:hypothetical protein [Rhodoferax sp.]
MIPNVIHAHGLVFGLSWTMTGEGLIESTTGLPTGAPHFTHADALSLISVPHSMHFMSAMILLPFIRNFPAPGNRLQQGAVASLMRIMATVARFSPRGSGFANYLAGDCGLLRIKAAPVMP